jgi:hypothetical protein
MEHHLAKYQTYGQRLVKLQQAAVEWGLDHQREFYRTARKLRMLGANDTLMVDDDSELSILMEALVYETCVDQRKVIAAFSAQYPCDDDIDRQLAVATREAQLGLYQIEAIRKEEAQIALKALVAEATDSSLTNVALAASGCPGQVLAMRLLRLPDITIATGVFFPFEAGRAQRVVREWRKQPGLDEHEHVGRWEFGAF